MGVGDRRFHTGGHRAGVLPLITGMQVCWLEARKHSLDARTGCPCLSDRSCKLWTGRGCLSLTTVVNYGEGNWRGLGIEEN